MRNHWPLGRGRYGWSVANAVLAAGGCGIALAAAALISVFIPEPQFGPQPSAIRFWTLVLFVVAVPELTALWVFRAAYLRLLLPTPLDDEGLYAKVDPVRSVAGAALPFAAGVLAMAPLYREEGLLWTAAAVLYAWMLFRLLLPALALAAIRLRRLLVPMGYVAVWIVSVPAAVDVFAWKARTGAVVAPLSDWPFLVGVEPRAIRLAAAVALALVAKPVRSWCTRAAVASFGRKELLDYVYPIERSKRQRRRRMIVERFRGGARARRFIFLVQQTTGLHRPLDWVKAGLVWLAAFAGITFVCRNGGGSGAHFVVTGGTLGVLLMWGDLSRYRARNGKFVPEQPLAEYTPPIGGLESGAAAALWFSALYFATGFLAMGAVELVPPLWASRSAASCYVAFPASRILLVSATNLLQVWLALLAMLLWSAIMVLLRRRPGAAVRSTVLFASMVLYFPVAFAPMFGAALLLGRGTAWRSLGALGLRVSYAIFSGAARKGTLDELPPMSVFELAAWLVPAALVVCLAPPVVLALRGRASLRARTGIAIQETRRGLFGREVRR